LGHWAAVQSMPDDYVPTWNGDPASFESFVTACEWYATGLKDQERKLAASRIWQRLTGAAKSVVKHLNPSDFDSPAGLNKLWALASCWPRAFLILLFS